MEATNLNLAIDPRSFHVFPFDGEFFLFDRETAALLMIDELTFRSMSAVERGESLEKVVQELQDSDPGFASAFTSALECMVEKGMFRYRRVDKTEQRKLMRQMWRHRPRRIQLLMAQGCNLGCRYCYAWRNGSNQKATLMPWEVAKSSVDHLVRNSGTRKDLQVTFFGGEPLLNLPVIRQVVEYCRRIEEGGDKQFTFELITNGTLLTREVTDWIVAEKFLLFISIDGWKEMHNHNRPAMSGEDVYDTIVSNAVYANEQFEKAKLFPIKVRANLTNRHHDAHKVGSYLASLGFKVIGVGAIEPLPHGDPSPSAMTEEQMEALFAEITEMLKKVASSLIAGQKVGRFEQISLNKNLAQLKPVSLKGVTCGVARNTQVVDNKGNIFPCHRYEGMDAYIIGNVFQGLNYELTMAYYAKLNQNATNRCHSCWIRDYCGGGCAWLLSAKDGHLADPTAQECERRRRGIERSLWLRQRIRTHMPNLFKTEERALEDFDMSFLTIAASASDTDDNQPTQEGSCSSCENCGPSGCVN